MREVEDKIKGGAVSEERSPLKEAMDWEKKISSRNAKIEMACNQP